MSTRLTPDLDQARRYIKVLTGGNFATFQTFSDQEGLKRVLPDGKLYDPNAGWHHGSFDALALYLTRQNAKGAGVYVMVNQGDGKGRTAANVQLVRALFLDTDGAPYPADLPLKPHTVVQSSPGRWHLYWLVDGLELGDFAISQQTLAKHYGTDPSIHDLPRVMRLPGFYHHKGAPVMVQLLEASDHRPYTAAEVCAAWPFLPERLEQVKKQEAEQERERAEIVRRATERRANPVAVTEDRARADKLLQVHHDIVASAGAGTRNPTLCRSAYTLGGYVATGYLDPQDVGDVLLAAAIVSGLPEGEARELIPRALRKGMDAPLELGSSRTVLQKRVSFTNPKPMQIPVTHAKGFARFFPDGERHKPDPCKAAKGVWGRAAKGVI